MSQAKTISRRALFAGRRETRRPVPRPPGIRPDGLDACTGCGACREACPTAIVALSGDKPVLDFGTGECTLCGACAEACPEPVFLPGRAASLSHIVGIGDACLAEQGVTCMTCRDVCPQAAIAFRPRIGGPFLPALQEAACTGCGACIAACPTDAISVAERPARQAAEAGNG